METVRSRETAPSDRPDLKFFDRVSGALSEFDPSVEEPKAPRPQAGDVVGGEALACCLIGQQGILIASMRPTTVDVRPFVEDTAKFIGNFLPT